MELFSVKLFVTSAKQTPSGPRQGVTILDGCLSATFLGISVLCTMYKLVKGSKSTSIFHWFTFSRYRLDPSLIFTDLSGWPESSVYWHHNPLASLQPGLRWDLNREIVSEWGAWRTLHKDRVSGPCLRGAWATQHVTWRQVCCHAPLADCHMVSVSETVNITIITLEL